MTDHLTNVVRETRIRKNITQEELANMTKVTRQTIIAIEKGNYTPSVTLAIKIAKTLKKPLESIFVLKST